MRAALRWTLRSRTGLAGLWLLICAGLTQAAPPRSLNEDINALLTSSRLGQMRVGVQIVALEKRPRVICEQHADQTFKPASTQKVLTTAAAMTLLPEDFKFTTVLALRGEDLIVIGAGDPATGDPKLARAAREPITAIFHKWADKLKETGIDRITGDLIFDDFVFEQKHLPESWEDHFKNQLQNWYAAPVGGLNFNDNCVDVVVKPGAGIGAPAEVTLIPNTPYIQLNNTAKTAQKGEPIIGRTGSSQMVVNVSGSVSKPGSPESATSLTVIDPGMFFASTLRTVLAAKGIATDGQIRRERVRLESGAVPEDLHIIATHEQDLAPVLERCDRDSQNMFAEALLKSVGAYVGAGKTPRQGSYATGRQIMELFLQKLGLNCSKCVIDDGSGLSHSNRVTPALLSGVLVYMHSHPRQEEWISYLATPGGTGTLRRRMKDLQGKVFAKTGTISGVSALCGYVHGPQGRQYAFSILCNDIYKVPKGGMSAPTLQDAICRKLANWDGPLLPGE